MTPRLPNLAPIHTQEWLNSGVDLELVALNVQSVEFEDLQDFYHPTRHNPDALHREVTRRYAYLESGWLVEGVDPLTGEPIGFKRLKSDNPREINGKVAKYEAPPGQPLRATFLRVPRHLAEKIATRAGVNLPEDYRPELFWQWVITSGCPIWLSEGEKKAGALLTQGYAAIALPGVNSGYRRIEKSIKLIPDLLPFASLGRKISICFDTDDRPEARQRVRLAALRTGRLFADQRTEVKLIQLPGGDSGKGIDDFLTAGGDLPRLIADALPLEHLEGLQHWELSYQPSVTCESRYLNHEYPKAGLVAIKSPKGTGKTEALKLIVQHAHEQGRKTLVLTHRISLGRAICERLGLPWIDERRYFTDLLGFGLCADSLHSGGRARVNPEEWRGATLILDECEQIMSHVLNSDTCRRERTRILKTLRELIKTVLTTGGLVIVQDADLSDLSIDLIRAYAGDNPPDPWLLVNTWKPQPWEVSLYSDPKPTQLLSDIDKRLGDGERLYVSVDSQKAKSKWGTQVLERRWQSKYPHLRILRIDSETVAEPGHPAYGIIDRLSEACADYDLVLASPSIGTGVSIDLKGHFHAVVGIFIGALPDTDIRQALSRVREAVPRLVWCERYGRAKIGGGSGYWKTLYSETHKTSREIFLQLLQLELDPDRAVDFVTYRAWCKIAARTNASHYRLFDNLRANLIVEGQRVTVIAPGDKELSREIGHEQADIPTPLTHEQCEAVAAAAPLEVSEVRTLEDKQSRTKAEREQLERHHVAERYGLEVTPELVHKDRDGWYAKIRLHWLVSQDFERTKARDIKRLADTLAHNSGEMYLPDTLRDLSAGRVKVIQALGILPLIGGEELTNTSPQAVAVHELATRAAAQIKRLLGVTVRADASPIETMARLLKCLGLSLTLVRKQGTRSNQVRVYCVPKPEDDREQVWEHWTIRDSLKTVSSSDTVVTTCNKGFIESHGDYPPSNNSVVTTIPPAPETSATIPTMPNWMPPAPLEAVPGRKVWANGEVLPVIAAMGTWGVMVASGLYPLNQVLLKPLEETQKCG